MHPAYSVIIFTVLSGAGLGQLCLLAIMVAAGHTPGEALFGAASTLLALALIAAGGIASAFHLGRPARAWRAFSQWRSSWLSREGVLMVLTLALGTALMLGWFGADRAAPWWRIVAAATAVLALATIWATAMIYASLKPVRQWHTRWTVAAYLVLAIMSGATIAYACLRNWGYVAPPGGYAALLWIACGLLVKFAYWRHIGRAAPMATAEQATGLGFIGKVRLLEPPHTEENFVQREMGFRIARKHADRLRTIAVVAGFVLPFGAVAAALALDGIAAALATALAVVLMLAGLVVERWLFFAEATHTSMLYYGLDRA